MACNYDFRATVDNGTCEYTSCYGCMSKRACNYNAHATHPASCEFVLPLAIEGDFYPVIGEEVLYTYPMTAGSDYEWNVVGGQILHSIAPNEVVVVWSASEGQISITERNSNGCEGSEVVMPLERTEELAELEFALYPNPANEIITINIDRLIAFVQIMDVMGRVQMSEQLIDGANRIDISHLAFGTYKVVVQSEGEQAIETLVIGK